MKKTSNRIVWWKRNQTNRQRLECDYKNVKHWNTLLLPFKVLSVLFSLTHWKQNLFLLDVPISVSKGDSVEGKVTISRNPEYRRHIRGHFEFTVIPESNIASEVLYRRRVFNRLFYNTKLSVVITIVWFFKFRFSLHTSQVTSY